jgi:microcystin degradation protein MlrC
LWHETNTFSPSRTRLEDFEGFQLKRRHALLSDYTGTRTEVGGVISAAAGERNPPQLLPLLFAAAVPSGPVEAHTFEFLLEQLVDEIRRLRPLDGVVLALHGAMVAESHTFPEGELVDLVRREIGGAPVAVSLDFHANVAELLSRTADVLVGYHTYPHTDAADRGAEALRLLIRSRQEQRGPIGRLVKLPLLTAPQAQATDEEPMRSIEALRASIEARPDVWTASVFPGFPYSDSDRLGAAAYVAADSPEVAFECANRLALNVWERRGSFVPALTEPEEAIAIADVMEGPVVLVDVADNIGGGSPGDGTLLLRLLEQRACRDAVAVVWDPVAVETLSALTPGTDVEAEIGGRSLRELGPPARLRGPAFPLGVVRYRRRGPYMAGQEVEMGRVVRVEAAAGQIVVTERRATPFDDQHLRAAGVDPESAHIIVTKSAVAWKAAFGQYARSAFYVRTPGLCPSDLTELRFRTPKALFPLDEGVKWRPG